MHDRFILSVAALFWVSPILGGFVLVTSTLQSLVPILYAKRIEAVGTAYSDAQEPFLFDDTIYQNVSLFSPVERSRVEDGKIQSI